MLSEFLLSEMNRLGSQDALPLHRQLYEALRRAMLDGKLGAGERLSSSRDLAQDLGLSRNTVVAALNQLSVEGYLVSRVGSGTFVNDNVPRVNPASAARPHLRGAPTVAPARLSARGLALSTTFCATELEVQPFTPGIADFSAFPLTLWQRLQNKHWRMTYPDMLDYNDSGGYAPLRRAIADYLRVFRSVQLDADQVIVTTGTQQSLELCARLLADHGDTVWVEDPAYWGAVKAFMATGLAIHPVRVDDEGICPGVADDAHPPKMIYLTPSHQYPTGAVMSLPRRHQLLSTARAHGAWVLEDDYDSEYRFSGPPISSLEGLDTDGRVLYMGTFSKVLYPGIKLGYLVVPKPLVAAFKQAHYDLNRPGQMPLQAALAEFIEMGHFSSALRRARQSYGERRAALLEALKPVLAAGTDGPFISGAEQGLHLCLRLPSHADDKALAQRLAQQGLTVRPLSAYCLARNDLKGLVIGYGYAPLTDIQRCGPVLSAAVRSLMSS
ncbi:PLP-dependent aminotransferase family protein [Hydrogenophaga sp.]|uniref:MocR-like pyridoxine biosynthesis transcription factor PdxR n=1 Tax=Hydrogenophaga sp. TaxID=1904254 RepID=UPI0027258CDC|nr:PLP-dependent aminotransferase family protein [Hydrogenophaga sp.]MDO9250297.1 PLP-dependent aminotransferase family protein [Hydrogenophaga sp.]MDP3326077.1 PLP-dependent aminotransferase family protein [Hydrogenophaga sp.]MDP3885717.1 PLP-dependent aminotransferase family protein [Hydrogenophaga sp.]